MARTRNSNIDKKSKKHETTHDMVGEFLQNYLKIIIGAFLALVIIGGLVAGGFVYYDYKSKQYQSNYEKVLIEFEEEVTKFEEKVTAEAEEYKKANTVINEKTGEVEVVEQTEEEIAKLEQKKEADKKRQQAEFEEIVKNHIPKVLKLAEETKWGYLHEYGYYIAAGLYYQINDYKNAAEYYKKSLKNLKNEVFIELAMQQYAICLEWQKDYDGALKVYKEIEEKFDNSGFKDRNFFNIGRIYQLKNNNDEAKTYYTKIIKNYSSSDYAKKARERILLMGKN